MLYVSYCKNTFQTLLQKIMYKTFRTYDYCPEALKLPYFLKLNRIRVMYFFILIQYNLSQLLGTRVVKSGILLQYYLV